MQFEDSTGKSEKERSIADASEMLDRLRRSEVEYTKKDDPNTAALLRQAVSVFARVMKHISLNTLNADDSENE